MTWKELKIITLQKVFAITDGKLTTDDTTREYLSAMPGAANEGLQLLATAGRFMKQKLVIEQGTGDAETLSPSSIRKYDLKELAEDFYSLDSDGVYRESGGQYGRTWDFRMEAGRILVLNAQEAGTWTIWYNAYPPALTEKTEDNYELPLYPEAAVLLPLYIASQIYKDDALGDSVQYRNEFEAGREALVMGERNSYTGRDNWSSVMGWW